MLLWCGFSWTRGHRRLGPAINFWARTTRRCGPSCDNCQFNLDTQDLLDALAQNRNMFMAGRERRQCPGVREADGQRTTVKPSHRGVGRHGHPEEAFGILEFFEDVRPCTAEHLHRSCTTRARGRTLSLSRLSLGCLRGRRLLSLDWLLALSWLLAMAGVLLRLALLLGRTGLLARSLLG